VDVTCRKTQILHSRFCSRSASDGPRS
jgi:hypothetical protein